MNRIKNKAKTMSMRSIRTHDINVDQFHLETRASSLDNRVVEGYAVIWDSKNSHGEIFQRGAFQKAINDRGPKSNSNFTIKFRHEHRETVALLDELYEDETGLYFRTKALDAGDLEDEILKKLKSGVFNNFSIGFRYVRGKYQWSDDYETIFVYEANLFEISVVGVPSDEATFAIRSNEDNLSALFDDTEKFIINLPKHLQLNARHMFAIYQTLITEEQINPEEKSLNQRDQQPDERSLSNNLDFDYIVKNLNL